MAALLLTPQAASAAFVFAHGAGAGMDHPFMAGLAAALGERGVATLRYQFPFMEQGSKRPDRPEMAQAAVGAAVRAAGSRWPGLALFAGGKSFGGRMTSQAQAQQALPNVRGLIFVGFPLHPAGKPATGRAAHLEQVAVPMLFLQGTRDTLADWDLMRHTAQRLGSRATLHRVEGADHGFQVLARSGRTAADVIAELASAIAEWTAGAHGRAPAA